MWEATLPASISEHYDRHSNNPSLGDTVIEILLCQFHHKDHPLVFTIAVSVFIVGTTLAPVLARTRHRKEVSADSVMSDFS